MLNEQDAMLPGTRILYPFSDMKSNVLVAVGCPRLSSGLKGPLMYFGVAFGLPKVAFYLQKTDRKSVVHGNSGRTEGLGFKPFVG